MLGIALPEGSRSGPPHSKERSSPVASVYWSSSSVPGSEDGGARSAPFLVPLSLANQFVAEPATRPKTRNGTPDLYGPVSVLSQPPSSLKSSTPPWWMQRFSGLYSLTWFGSPVYGTVNASELR